MLKQIALTIFALIATLALTSAQNNNTWTAYLFDDINYELIRVDANGNTEAFSLGLVENEFVADSWLSISNSGELVAMCKVARSEGNVPSDTHILVVQNIETGAELYTETFEDVTHCSVTAFSEDDSLFALSLATQTFPASEDEEAISTWSLNLVDVATGQMPASISNETPDMPVSDMFPDFAINADVIRYIDNTITFMGIPAVGMGGPAMLPVYEWNADTDTIIQLEDAFGRVNSDYLAATGELVYPYLDEAINAAQPDGPLPIANSINVLDAEGNDNTIYQNEDQIIVRTIFVQNGEAIAIMLLEGFDPERDPQEMAMLSLVFLNRDGTLTAFEPNLDGNFWIENVSDGTLIVHTPNPTGDTFPPTQILFWDGSDLTQIAEYLPDYSNGWSPPQITWVSSSAVASDLPSFTVPQ